MVGGGWYRLVQVVGRAQFCYVRKAVAWLGGVDCVAALMGPYLQQILSNVIARDSAFKRQNVGKLESDLLDC